MLPFVIFLTIKDHEISNKRRSGISFQTNKNNNNNNNTILKLTIRTHHLILNTSDTAFTSFVQIWLK